MSSLFEDEISTIEAVRAKWSGCTKCFFSSKWHPYGPCLPQPNIHGRRVFVVGQWPGNKDMEKRVPFTGPQGLVTRRMLLREGFQPEDLYYSNVLLCGCPVVPTKSILGKCRSHVDETLDVLRPLLIIALGDLATKRLGIRGLAGNRGQVHRYRSYPVVACIHTAAIARQKSRATKLEMECQVQEDLIHAFRIFSAAADADRTD